MRYRNKQIYKAHNLVKIQFQKLLSVSNNYDGAQKKIYLKRVEKYLTSIEIFLGMSLPNLDPYTYFGYRYVSILGSFKHPFWKKNSPKMSF